MKNSMEDFMRRVFSIGISCLVLSLFLSCKSTSVTTSTVPLIYTDDQRTKIEILGEVFYESKDRVGYIGLLKAARSLYPNCDYVIDIMAEQRITTTTTTTSYFPLFFIRDKNSVNTEIIWVMRGTAIRYIK